jgi:long-chain acyl-CoA synthetase
VLLPLPFHHVYPFMIGLMAVLASGATLVTPAGLTGPEIVRALREGEVTTIVGVPRFYEALVSGLEARVRARGRAVSALFQTALRVSILARRTLGVRPGRLLFRTVRREIAPRVRLVASGGARLDPDVARTLEALGWEVSTGYGLTETAPILTFNVPGQTRLETAGRPVRGVELRLDDPDGDGVGEVLARGPNVFAGYHNLPDKTAEAFVDGWFRTGDLGRFDRDGYLELVGRASDILVPAGGKNVAPEDVEKIYLEHPAIREIGVLLRDGRLAAVVVPDPGEVRRQGASSIEHVVREAVSTQSRRLTSWQRVGEYAITRDSLPRTRLGKLRRHLLPDLYERARRGDAKAEPRHPASLDELSGEDRALVEHPVAKRVWDWLAARYRDQRVTPDTSLQLDLGVDSLEWMNLTLELRERGGVELSEETIGGVETVRDLLRAAIEAAETAEPARAVDPLQRPEEVLSPEQRRWLDPPGRVVHALGISFYVVNRSVLRRMLAIRADGLARLPARGHCVLAPNHRSYLDPLVLAAVLPRDRLEATFWGGWTPLLFGNPIARLFSRMTHVVPVGPGRTALSTLAVGAAVLARGRNLVWFPEGGRSPSGELQPFQAGIGVLLDHLKVPVVPVFIHGTERALPHGRALPRRASVTVVFGQPLDPRDLAARGRGEDAAHRIADALHAAVAELGRATPAGAAHRAA